MDMHLYIIICTKFKSRLETQIDSSPIFYFLVGVKCDGRSNNFHLLIVMARASPSSTSHIGNFTLFWRPQNTINGKNLLISQVLKMMHLTTISHRTDLDHCYLVSSLDSKCTILGILIIVVLDTWLEIRNISQSSNHCKGEKLHFAFIILTLGWLIRLCQLDVNNVFLYGSLTKQVFIFKPPRNKW